MSVAYDDVLRWIRRFAAEVEANKAYLTQLDAAVGDGDHGINMQRGMSAVVAKLDAQAGDQDVGALLKTVGMTLVSTVGGAGGPLYGTLFLQMGTAASGKGELSPDDWAGALEAGELFGIYPEGTRSKDGRLHRGHTGVAMLAVRTGAPVIPIGFIGTDKAQPVGAKMMRPFKTVTIRIGRPLDFAPQAGQPPGQRALRAMTDTVMTEIQHLSGQEYTGRYAPHGA